MKPTLLIDGDDTLWQMGILYLQVRDRFFDFMASLGFEREEAKERFIEIERRNVDRLGVNKARFPTSMVETYRELCYDLGPPALDGLTKMIEKIGYSIFDMSPFPIDGVADALRALTPHYRLAYYSMGDQEVQSGKLDTMGVRGYFDTLYIVEKKDVDALRDILAADGADPATTWVIGDSLRSDINPALSCGLKTIWVHNGTSWRDGGVERLEGECYEVKTFPEALAVLLPKD